MPLEYYGRAMDGVSLPPVQDAEKISPVCDYQLPRVLREMGVISYEDDLSFNISILREIPKGSLPETEIRLATADVIVKLLAGINKERKNLGKPEILMPHLDYRLWAAGRDSKTPHHITLTTDY